MGIRESVRVVRQQQSRADFEARKANKFCQKKNLPKTPETTIVVSWFAWKPVSSKENPQLQNASYSVQELQAEIAGDLQKRAINAQFSIGRAVRSAATSSAANRAVAIYRTRKTRNKKVHAIQEKIEQIKHIKDMIFAITAFLQFKKAKKRIPIWVGNTISNGEKTLLVQQKSALKADLEKSLRAFPTQKNALKKAFALKVRDLDLAQKRRGDCDVLVQHKKKLIGKFNRSLAAFNHRQKLKGELPLEITLNS